MKRGTGILLILLLALLLVAQAATVAGALPARCAVIIDAATRQQAVAELSRYANALQAGAITDGSMAHVLFVSELAQILADAPAYGCEAEAR